MTRETVVWLSCAVPCAIVLGYSAIIHLDNPLFFLGSVYAYDLFGSTMGVLIAAVVPGFQLTLALFLLFDVRFFRTGYILSALFFMTFCLLQTSAIIRQLDISCGCFGASEAKISWRSIAIPVFGFALSFIGSVVPRRPGTTT